MQTEKPVILVIDDDPHICRSIAAYLEDLDYDPHTTHTGSEGMQRFRTLHPDLLLVDLILPDTTGLQVISRIRKTDSEIPIIVISGVNDIGAALKAIRHGAWDFIQKPIVEMEILYYSIKRALEKSEIQEQNRKYQQHLEELAEQRTQELKYTNLQLEQEIRKNQNTVYELNDRIRKTQAALTCASQFSFEADRRTGEMIWSGALNSYLGFSDETSLQQFENWLDLIHPDDRARVRGQFDLLLPRNGKTSVRYKLRMHSGEYQVWESIMTPLEYHHDQPVLWIGICRDITRRQQNLQNSEDQRELYERLFENASDGLILMQDGKFVECNHRITEIFRCTRDYIIGKTPDEVSPPIQPDNRDTKTAAGELIQNAESGNPRKFEWVHSRPDGSEFTAEISLSSVSYKGQLHLIVIMRDITAQKSAEQKFRDIAAHQNLILNNLPIAYFTSEPGGSRKIKFSQQVSGFTGYTPEEFSQNPELWKSGLHPEDAPAVIQAVDAAAEMRSLDIEYRWKHADGHYVWIRDMAVLVDGPNIGGPELIGAWLDISDLKEAVSSLQTSEERFRSIFNHAPMGIQILDDQGEHVMWNTAFLRILGYSQSEGEDLNLSDRTFPDDRNRCDEMIENLKSGQCRDKSLQIRYYHRSGHLTYCHLVASSITDTKDRVQYIIMMIVDITDQKNSEKKLKTALSDVQDLTRQLEAENIYLQQEIKLDHNFDQIIGNSLALKLVLKDVEKVAGTDSTVLILGETGTGKELIARAIHSLSHRNTRPLLKVNCASLPGSLIESELFGHEKGAFTGAAARHKGRFELANGGTLFLDEIGELPLELQPKLLRILQEGEFERVGGSATLKTDARIITATNRNLKQMTIDREFRKDLYYRLNVFPIYLPPLNQRREDIPLLIHHFVKKTCKRTGKEIKSVTSRFIEILQSRNWIGNIRELENLIQRTIVMTDSNVLDRPAELSDSRAELPDTAAALAEVEKNHILKILELTRWQIEGTDGAARILDINPSTLRSRMKKHGISKS